MKPDYDNDICPLFDEEGEQDCQKQLYALCHVAYEGYQDEFWLPACRKHIESFADMIHCYRLLPAALLDREPLPLVGVAAGSTYYESAWNDVEI